MTFKPLFEIMENVKKASRSSSRSKPKKAAKSAIDGDAVAAALEEAATRHRLLNAAGAVFAEVGYERAHVREICRRAKANVAAIKYHFGGKYPLYEAAIGYWFERQERQHRLPTSSPAGVSSSDELKTFVAMFVGRLLDREKPAWHARLMAREMVEPTGVLDKMVKQSMLPMTQHLRKIVRRIVGPECPQVALERALLSVVSQCVFYLHCRPVLERMFPEHAGNPDIEAIVSHIAAFSEAGLLAICRDNAKRRKARS